MAAKKKLLKEEFAKFFEEPTRVGLRELLQNNHGEYPNLDFKVGWLPSPQLARHILGIGNTGGGCIIVGVAENDDKTLDAIGLEKITDKAKITDGIKKYIQNTLLDGIEIGDFAFEDSEYPKLINKKFQALFISSEQKQLPYLSVAEGDGIELDTIYIRRGTTTVKANYTELQGLINKRLETGYSSQTEIDLQSNIEHLKILYGQINKINVRYNENIYQALIVATGKAFFGQKEEIPNPIYPEEGFDEFIVKMIEKKKLKIEILLGVVDL